MLYGVVDTLAFVHRLASQKRKVAEDRKALLRVEKKGKGAQKVRSNCVNYLIVDVAAYDIACDSLQSLHVCMHACMCQYV